LPVTPWQFDILEIESKKKQNSCRGRAFRVAPSVFLGAAVSIKEASQTRDYFVAKGAHSARFACSGQALHRATRPDPSRREERLLGMTSKLRHC
jgi:hypothetical protein